MGATNSISVGIYNIEENNATKEKKKVSINSEKELIPEKIKTDLSIIDLQKQKRKYERLHIQCYIGTW